jgi:hypothetical protein
MARRFVIKTESYRAEDLATDDVVKLRIHNRVQWVQLTKDAGDPEGEHVWLTYRGSVVEGTVQVCRWDLVPVQIEKGA